MRFVVVLLCAYHAYLMHCHTVAVAGKGTAAEQVCSGSSLISASVFSPLCLTVVGPCFVQMISGATAP